ncbi:hypothetical protein [Pseudaminobacter soli (ex Li et al. 2025)]|uniref:Transposase n=1 Tax=Pseudaminobacter soli (ex Li et al. 2025) TaxID=1295366 RepID=A0A2P7SBL4_9HYPH|nr:hypothetical protein [Mesorhizobium soli]PSJ59879.1 hypothetical protein C7I85_16220 [Mesorhizobium soli]
MSLNSFQQISEENFLRLEAYIEKMQNAGLKLPSRGGKVNKTAVATACGFNRETFTQNKRFEQRLDEAVVTLGLESPTAPEPPRRDGAAKARITMLEQQLAALRGENYELRRKLARYEHATLTGRRVIP